MNPSDRSERLWTAARRMGLPAVALLCAGLLLRPEPTLTIFWNVVIPLLPAVFLVHPALWRNVCPLATVGGGAPEGRVPARWPAVAGWVGMALLFILVPGRRVLFNHDGTALAALVVVVAALAWLLGRLLPRKAGFCNGLCPVLPVERLYGQRPVISVSNPRCSDCTACAPVGCLDLSPRKTAAQLLGPARSNGRWTFTAFGGFAAAFPGLVLGYFLVEDTTWAGAPAVYATAWGLAFTSWMGVTAVVRATGVKARVALPALGATTLGLYYWFALPTALETVAVPAASLPARAACLGLLAVWTWGSLQEARPVAVA